MSPASMPSCLCLYASFLCSNGAITRARLAARELARQFAGAGDFVPGRGLGQPKYVYLNQI